MRSQSSACLSWRCRVQPIPGMNIHLLEDALSIEGSQSIFSLYITHAFSGIILFGDSPARSNVYPYSITLTADLQAQLHWCCAYLIINKAFQ